MENSEESLFELSSESLVNLEEADVLCETLNKLFTETSNLEGVEADNYLNEFEQSTQSIDKTDDHQSGLINTSCDFNLNKFSYQNFNNSKLIENQLNGDLSKLNNSTDFDLKLSRSDYLSSELSSLVEEADNAIFDEQCYSIIESDQQSTEESKVQIEQKQLNASTMNESNDSTNLLHSSDNNSESSSTVQPTRRSNRQKCKFEKTNDQSKQTIVKETYSANNSVHQQTPAFNQQINDASQNAANDSNQKAHCSIVDEADQTTFELNNELKTSGKKCRTPVREKVTTIEAPQSTRPQRQRKIPKRLNDEDFDFTGFHNRSSNAQSTNSTPKSSSKKFVKDSKISTAKIEKVKRTVFESDLTVQPTQVTIQEDRPKEETEIVVQEDKSELCTVEPEIEEDTIDQNREQEIHFIQPSLEEPSIEQNRQLEETESELDSPINKIPEKKQRSTIEEEKRSEIEEGQRLATEEKEQSETKEESKFSQTESAESTTVHDKVTLEDKIVDDKVIEDNQSEDKKIADKQTEELIEQITPDQVESMKEDKVESEYKSGDEENAVVSDESNESCDQGESDKGDQKVKKVPETSNSRPQQSADEQTSDSDDDRLKVVEKQQLKILTPAQKKKSHLKNNSLSDSDKPKRSAVKPAIKDLLQSSGSDENIDEDDAEWNSDDDPDKLWCICRKPHNNKFMIQCDQCKDWFHGSCVGITQSQGSQYEKLDRKWFCSSCREEQQNDRKLIPDRKSLSIKDKGKRHSHPASIGKQRSIGELKKLKPPEGIELKKRKYSESDQLREELKKRRSSLDNLSEKKIKQSPEIKEKIEQARLVKLIKRSKEMKKKKELTESQLKNHPNSKNPERKSPPSADRSPSGESNQDSVKSDQLVKQTANANKLESDKKKKNSQSNFDPLIDDLFKPAEPIIVQKTKKLMKRSNSTSSEITNSSLLNCVNFECRKSTQKINDKESVYCSKECLEKHVKESISLVRKLKRTLKNNSDRKPIKEDGKKVTLIDKRSGKLKSGSDVIGEDKVIEYILNNPTYEVMTPNYRKHSTNDSLVKKPNEKVSSTQSSSSNAQSSSKDSSSKDSSSKEATDKGKPKMNETDIVRLNVRKQLKKALYGRLENCKDLQLEKSEVKRIVSTIEFELFKHFNKDVVNSKYKTRFRSLLFNLNDTKNEGLFKKVLTNKLHPDKLVQMSSEELASPELAKWRERENRHSIEMIKKDAEQQAHQMVVKKTHKGEEVIETKVILPKFEEVKKPESTITKEDSKISIASSTNKSTQSNATTVAKVVSAKEKANTNPLDLLFKDTTEEHGIHLFDLHCKICNNQAKEDLSLTHKPKPLSTFEKQLLESRAELMNERPNADSNSSHSPLRPNESEHSSKQTKAIHSCWNGYIIMQDVSKFIAFAYKVSGAYESQDIVDIVQVCGRIAPEQVYYYLKKIRSSSRNDITILKFIPANDDEKVGYESFFNYLHKRSRFGVIGNSGKTIKDFYIFPLAKDQELDPSMLPPEGVGLEEKNNRPNLLLGLLVRRSHTKVHHSKEHDKSMHYSPDTNFIRTNSSKASTSTSNNRDHQSHHYQASHTPPKNQRSYTPPPMPACHSKRPAHEENSSSNSMDDVSYTPPRKDDNQIDEPYDPESHALDYQPTMKKSRVDHRPDQVADESSEEENKRTPTKNLAILLEHLSKNTKLCEKGLTKVIISEIGMMSSDDEKQQLWSELKRKVEESERQLEIQRKATESAFNQATGSSGNYFDSNVIPGLDGDFSSMNEIKTGESSCNSNLILDHLELPDSLKKVIEKFNNIEDLTKADLLDDPIVKNYGNLNNEEERSKSNDLNEPDEQQDDEPMDVSDEEDNQNTIIEVNDLNATSPFQLKDDKDATPLTDDQILIKKAKIQLDFLKQMEREQAKLIAEQMATTNQ